MALDKSKYGEYAQSVGRSARAATTSAASDAAHVDTHTDAPEARPTLPALVIQVRGEIVSCNLPKFQADAAHFLATINRSLKTDEDFVVAKETIARLKSAEEEMDSKLDAAIAQMSSIEEVKQVVLKIKAECRQVRLNLANTVETEEAARKMEMIDTALARLEGRIATLEAETKPIKIKGVLDAAKFAGVIKGKRNLQKMQEAIDEHLKDRMAEASAIAMDLRAKLAWGKLAAAGYGQLFHDLKEIIYLPMEKYKATITGRVESHKAAVVAEAAAEIERQRKAEAARIAEEIERKRLEREEIERKGREHAATLRNAIESDLVRPEAPARSHGMNMGNVTFIADQKNPEFAGKSADLVITDDAYIVPEFLRGSTMPSTNEILNVAANAVILRLGADEKESAIAWIIGALEDAGYIDATN